MLLPLLLLPLLLRPEEPELLLPRSDEPEFHLLPPLSLLRLGRVSPPLGREGRSSDEGLLGRASLPPERDGRVSGCVDGLRLGRVVSGWVDGRLLGRGSSVRGCSVGRVEGRSFGVASSLGFASRLGRAPVSGRVFSTCGLALTGSFVVVDEGFRVSLIREEGIWALSEGVTRLLGRVERRSITLTSGSVATTRRPLGLSPFARRA